LSGPENLSVPFKKPMRVERLIVFLKAPRPGAVKTRLAASLGTEGACAVYRRLVERLLWEMAPLPEVELRFTPDDAAAEIRSWIGEHWVLAPQGSGDLGERLAAAAATAFRGGAKRVALIGSDCPEVMRADITAAWTGLLAHEVVLGPAQDGGYWLIGLRAPQPGLFAGMPWSTPAVLEETLARCREARLSVGRLRELADIDTEADWQRFLQSPGRAGFSVDPGSR